MDTSKDKSRYINNFSSLNAKRQIRKVNVWVSHEITRKEFMYRVYIYLLDPFLKEIVTGDKRGITYINLKGKRSQCKGNEPAKTVRKILLRICWDWQAIIHYELLPSGKTLYSIIYCQKFDQQEGNYVSSGQRQTTHIDGDPSGAPRALVGRFLRIDLIVWTPHQVIPSIPVCGEWFCW